MHLIENMGMKLYLLARLVFKLYFLNFMMVQCIIRTLGVCPKNFKFVFKILKITWLCCHALKIFKFVFVLNYIYIYIYYVFKLF